MTASGDQKVEAIFNTSAVATYSAESLAELKRHTSMSPRGRFRYCLHRGADDMTHEMIIALHRAVPFMPHRHPDGKSESYHVIEGRMRVFIFDDDGKVTQTLEMGDRDSGASFLYRLSRPTWHMPVPLSEWVIYHEVYTGPFQRGMDVTSAPWAPPEADPAACEAYLRGLGVAPGAWNNG